MGGDGVFWDRVACVYDVFANVINRKANRALCAAVEPWIEPGDEVLECACGTGLLSGVIAQRGGHLTATDFSAKMMRRAARNLSRWSITPESFTSHVSGLMRPRTQSMSVEGCS